MYKKIGQRRETYVRGEGGYGLASRKAQAKVTVEARLSANLYF